MQEQTDNTANTVPTTGRGYNRHATDAAHASTGVATELYAPVPGDDNDTRPGMVEDIPTSTSSTASTNRDSWSGQAVTTGYTSANQQRTETTPPTAPEPASSLSPASRTHLQRPTNTTTDGGMMEKVKSNPLAVVAAATAGGMLVGRIMRSRGKQRNERYMGQSSLRGFQGYQQPSYRQYQGATGYQGYQGYQGQPGNQGYLPAGYQNPSGFQGAPQYRPEQEFQQGQGFQSSHDNFRGGSNWD